MALLCVFLLGGSSDPAVVVLVHILSGLSQYIFLYKSHAFKRATVATAAAASAGRVWDWAISRGCYLDGKKRRTFKQVIAYVGKKN